MKTLPEVFHHQDNTQAWNTSKGQRRGSSRSKAVLWILCLITNEPMDAVTALELYRNKDVVEKAFGNLKERLNMRRTLVSSEQSLDGKLFVQFVR